MKDVECKIDIFKVADDWTYQIQHGELSTNPGSRVFKSALASKRAAAMAADRLRLSISEIVNLEEAVK
jgi:hypothetical protein